MPQSSLKLNGGGIVDQLLLFCVRTRAHIVHGATACLYMRLCHRC